MIERHPWGDLAVPDLPPPHDVVILGVPWDGSAGYRKGAAEAPRRLREVSATSQAVSEEGVVVRAGGLRVRDRGDVVPAPEETGLTEASRGAYFSRVEAAMTGILREAAMVGRDAFVLSIGGDHAVTIPLVRGFGSKFPEGFGLVWLDAHPDAFDTYEGSRLSHACPLRRALDSSRLKPEHVVLLGTRSYNEAELEFLRERRIAWMPARAIDRQGVEAAVALARDRLRGVGAVYLSIDIDVADPSCAPGTGYPVAGGLSSRQLLDLARDLVRELPVRGMDLVEVAPPLDPSGITLFLALQIVFETFAVLAAKR